jgi:hypothetical protein
MMVCSPYSSHSPAYFEAISLVYGSFSTLYALLKRGSRRTRHAGEREPAMEIINISIDCI